jgi:alpha-tubulin suppressor-like RCC1 family protein
MKSTLFSQLPWICVGLLGLVGCTADERDFSSGSGGGGAGGAGGAECSAPVDCAAGPNETATCLDGKCAIACSAGFADCIAEDPGCETSATTRENCGACGVVCATECSAQSPKTPPFCNDPIDISAGFNHTCVIRKDGTLWCWGRNLAGELGIPGEKPHVFPNPVPLPGKAVKVAAGGGYGAQPNPAHTCVILEDTTVFCWGNGQYGQLGIGGSVSSPVPTQVTSLVNVAAIAAGARHTCAVKTDGDLYCWGDDTAGQIGNGMEPESLSNPGLILQGAKQVDAGEQHTCAVMLAGGLKCWGFNFEGALGTGDSTNRFTPADAAPPLLDGVEEVAVGDRHTCARRNNEVYCFGNDYNGACAANTWGPVLKPTLVAVPDVTQVGVGLERSGAVSGPKGLVKMWGVQPLGDGTSQLSGTPVEATINGVARIAAGYQHTCALKTNGEVWCWGEDEDGQLGNGPISDTQLTPVPVIWSVVE